MFNVERFTGDCRAAGAVRGASAVLEVVAGAVSAPSEVLESLGEPQRAGFRYSPPIRES